jgi:hypothetical protein
MTVGELKALLEGVPDSHDVMLFIDPDPDDDEKELVVGTLEECEVDTFEDGTGQQYLALTGVSDSEEEE